MNTRFSRAVRGALLAGVASLSVSLIATSGAWAQDMLTIVNPSDAQPNNILPIRAGNMPWVGNVFEALFQLDQTTLEPQPVLATAWDMAEDGLSMHITLRDDVTFHTGRPMTAEDVKYTIEVAQDPATSSQFGFIARDVSSIEVASDTELQLAFNKPLANIFEFFSRTPIVDKDTYDQRVDGSQVVGTGPYKFVEWQPGASVLLERYEGYRDPEAGSIPKIEIVIISDPTAAISALRSNRGQASLQMQPRDVIEFSNSPQFQLLQTGGSIYPFGLDVTQPPFDNKLVRQAVAYAIDRERVNDQIFDGMGIATDLFWGVGSPGYDEGLATHYSYDPDKARALLAEAGVSDVPMPIALHALPSQRAIFEIIQNNLNEVGFKVEADILDVATYDQRQVAGDLGPAFLQLHGMVGLSSATILGAAPAVRQGNPSNFWPDEYVALREAVQTARSTEETAAAVLALSEYMLDEAFSLPIVQAATVNVLSSSVTGVTFNGNGYPVFASAEFN